LNNPTEKLKPPQHLKTLLYAPEIGSSGTQHFQGYIELATPQALSFLKAWLPGAHFEPRRGTQWEAAIYCLKNFTICETDTSSQENSSDSIDSSTSISFGRPQPDIEVCGVTTPIILGFEGSWQDYLESIKPKKQKESVSERLKTVKAMLDAGQTDVNIATADFELWVKYHKSFSAYKALIAPKRNHDMELVILVGPTGCGKSRYCLERYPDAYWKQRSQWWDGYERHDTVVIDEYYGWLPYDLLLRVADRYPMQVEVKGGQVNFTAKTICITSNIPPKMWYKNITNLGALYRRVTKWIVFNSDFTYVESDNYPTSLESYQF